MNDTLGWSVPGIVYSVVTEAGVANGAERTSRLVHPDRNSPPVQAVNGRPA